ncbi:PREDICTED: WD repeat and HMG-box DNA-binding protein 1 isoform X2 [Diuraphis noxia]|uniref:WD repeat and HMG-box DNA-binding protein 1 isoform X2 n=1 Tax=Diuraphis noxia TaxID=143948 RepID=UPI00076388E5|nr:PREDICTED: WD repeat and HMG-box DNA-binding protein 1 isoform X2 [Diuraphis noxia]
MSETKELDFPRYAHVEGHTDVCYSEDGRYLITCGQDGDIRIWDGIEDGDPIEKCVGSEAFAVHQSGDMLYVGDDHHTLQVYTFPKAELVDTLTRFTASVCCLDSSKDGKLIAAGGCDSSIQVVNKDTKSVWNFNGHKSPILSIKFDTLAEFLVSSSCDGTVKVWSIEKKSVVKEWTSVIPVSNAFQHSKIKCTPAWDPIDGNLLAIPFSKEIKLFQRGLWRELYTLHDYRLSEQEITVMSWSKCGRYIAAGTNTGFILAWNVSSQVIVLHAECKERYSIRSLVWCPKNGEHTLAYCDDHGQLGLVQNAGSDDFSVDATNGKENILMTDEESSDNVISLDQIKHDAEVELNKQRGVSLNNVDGLEIDEDNSNLSSKYIPPTAGFTVDLQSPFQPCSTPVHLQRRFMVFNDVGYARQNNTADENVIDVDFHDSTIHHAFRIKNVLGHTIAAMCQEALVLGCETQDNTPSKLVCVLLNSWDGKREWTVDIPDDDDICGLAVTSDWIAVASVSRLLRLFTLGGGQREIISIPGPIVAIQGSRDRLVVVHHCGAPIPGEQNLRYCVYKIDSSVEAICSGYVPLFPKSTLRWVGFSDYGSLCILDSAGTLRMLIKSYWSPLCYVDNTWNDTTNHYFVIGVSEARQDIRCILCKGSYYPSTTPHPFLNEIPWQIPLCDLNQEKGELEEKFWRSNIALSILPEEEGLQYDKELKTTFLKLFAMACKSGHDMRALEICKLIRSEQYLNLALKYTMRVGNSSLASKITTIIENELKVDDEPKPVTYSELFNGPSTSYNKNTNYVSQQSQDLFSEKYSPNDTEDNNKEPSSILAVIKKKQESELMNESNDIDRAFNPFKKKTGGQANISIDSLSPFDQTNEPLSDNKRKSDLSDSSEDINSINKSKKPKGVSKLSSFIFKK